MGERGGESEEERQGVRVRVEGKLMDRGWLRKGGRG